MSQSVFKVGAELGSAAETLRAWRQERPGSGVLALLPEQTPDKGEGLRQLCSELGIPVCGALFPALVTEAGFVTEGAWLIRLDDAANSFLLPLEGTDACSDGRAIAEAVSSQLDAAASTTPRPTLFLIFDSMLPHIESVLAELYGHLADRVCYAGVSAGSETFQPMPCVFADAEPISNGVLALLLPGDSPFVVEHGYEPPAQSMIASASDGNRIISIDWAPAFDMYREVIRQSHNIELNRDNFYEYGVHFPFGIVRANGEVAVRIPVALNDRGEIFCIGEIPENAMLVLLRAPRVDQSHCLERLANGLRQAQPAPLLTFYCAGRRMHLAEGATKELETLRQLPGTTLLAGALSLGEISTTASTYPVFHNAALVCSYW